MVVSYRPQRLRSRDSSVVADVCFILLPNTILHHPKIQPPLGVLYLSAVMKRLGAKVRAVDWRDRVGILNLPLAKHYLFSCTTPEMQEAIKQSDGLPGSSVVGGPHPTLMVNDCIGHFDTIVVGEGEVACERILAGQKGVINTGRLLDLDSLPLPDWDLIDCFSEELYPGEKYGKGQRAVTIITSRGCNYNCSFCGNCFRKPVVHRSVDNIMLEIDTLIDKYGVNHFRFVDDNFTDRADIGALLREMASRDMHFRCHTRAKLFNILTLGLAEMLYWAGCEEIAFGLESADREVLKLINKGEEPEDFEDAICIAQHIGLKTKVYLVMGLPGETEESVALTKHFMVANKPDKWTLNRFTPYPGCAIFNDPARFGVKILDWNYSHWWNFVDNSVLELEDASVEVLNKRYQDMYSWLSKGEYLK